VLERAGHTEGSIELCKLAGLLPSAVICEIINEDGSMARKPDLERFSERFGIPIVTIDDLIRHQISASNWLDVSRSAEFPNRHTPDDGRGWRIRSFKNRITGAEHALIELEPKEGATGAPLVRIHSECLTGDALGSLRCDCGFQLEQALEQIAGDPAGGAVVYLKNHEGRGIGLFNKIEAYALQDSGRDTYEANLDLGFQPDERNYWDAVKILESSGRNRVRLITHNPEKARELASFGIRVEERVQLEARITPENRRYLQTKRDRFHHDLGNV